MSGLADMTARHPHRTVLVLGSESDRRHVCDELAGSWYVLGCEIDMVPLLMRAVLVDAIVVIGVPSDTTIARVRRGIAGTRLSLDDVVFVQEPERLSAIRERVESISGIMRRR